MERIDIINKFSPIIYFHRMENYYPVSSEFLLQNSIIIDNLTDEIIIESPTNLDIYDICIRKKENKAGITLKISEYILNGENPISQVPIYAFYKEFGEFIYISYSALFAYNGDYKILNTFDVGSHDGDLEHLTVEIKKSDLKLNRVMFSSHTTKNGVWVEANKIQMEKDSKGKNKIVAYSALNGHGFYKSEGLAFRLYGFANDHLEKGLRWEPKALQIYEKTNPNFDAKTMSWIYFCGKIGEITPLSEKNWFGSKRMEILDNKDLSYPRLYNKNNKKIINILYILILIILIDYVFKVTYRFFYSFDINPILRYILKITFLMTLYLVFIILLKEIIKRFDIN